MTLEERIAAVYVDRGAARSEGVLELLAEFRAALNRGEARAASRGDGGWRLHPWVKMGIALMMRFGAMREGGEGTFDLDTLPRRVFQASDQVRIPSASAMVRDGSYLGAGCVVMPGTSVSPGVYLGEQVMLDANASVGACAQVGARARLNAGVQVQGQLEPLTGWPAIIGDDASVGANCTIGAGVLVGNGAIVFPGVSITRLSRIYDPIRKQKVAASGALPLMVPERAIVMRGARPVTRGVAANSGVQVEVLLIAGYTDEKDLPEFLLDRLLQD